MISSGEFKGLGTPMAVNTVSLDVSCGFFVVVGSVCFIDALVLHCVDRLWSVGDTMAADVFSLDF